MLLAYDVSIIGTKNVDQALAGLEKKFSRSNDRVSRMRPGRAAAGAGRSAEREALAAERKVAQAHRMEERLQAREQERQAAYWGRARQQSAYRSARIEEQSAKRLASFQTAEAERRARFIQATVGNSAGRVWSGIKTVGKAGAAAVGVGGAALAASSVAQAGRLDDISRRLSVQSREAGTQGVDPAELSKRFSQAGIETGMDPEEIAKGTAKYVSITGDLATAMSQMRAMGTFAQATGSDIEDLSTITANFAKLGITSFDDVTSALATLTMQGKKGSFELKDMGQLLPQLLSQISTMGAKGLAGSRQFGGLLQVVQKATGNADETGTAIANMFNHLGAKNSDMESGKAFGNGRKVSAYTDKGHTTMRDYRDVIPEMIDAAAGDLPKLHKILDIRGEKALNPFTSAYNQTYASSRKGGATDKAAREAGKAAVQKVLDDASNVKGDYKEIQRDAQDVMRGFNVQMEMLNTELKAAVASELFPELVKLAPRLKELVPAVGKAARLFVQMASVLTDNPLLGLGAALSASLSIELGKAGIASLFRKAITGGGSSAPLPGASPAGLGVGGAFGVGAAAGLTIASAIYFTGVATFENAKFEDKQAGAALNDVRNADYSDEGLAKARAAAKVTAGNAEEAAKPGFFQRLDDMFEVGPHKGPSSLDTWADNAMSGGTRTEHARTATSFDAEAQKRLALLESLNAFMHSLEKAGVSSDELAKRMDAASLRLGVVTPNRGNSPSPVKP